jgi:hypothetical protein
MVLLVRALAWAGHGKQIGQYLSKDVFSLLAGLELPIEPVLQDDLIQFWMNPLPGVPILEIRQQSVVVPTRGGDYPAVYPFRPPTTTWHDVFDLMSHEDTPCLINVHLQPTRLRTEESCLLAEMASVTASSANYNFNGMYYSGPIEDPQSRLLSRLYSDYAQRLSKPFSLLVQVIGPSVGARSIAQALGAEATQTIGLSTIRAEDSVPSGFDVLAPETAEEHDVARRNLTALDLHGWGVPDTCLLPRLPYLVDARTATSMFRFPVACGRGVPGVETRLPFPSHDGPRRSELGRDDILIGETVGTRSLVTISTSRLSQHALVAGMTGFGKTTTCMSILAQLWKHQIPFLVIEPVGKEYRAFMDAPFGKDVRVFTLGNESISPFRLNPLQVLPGVTVEQHASRIMQCLVAAMPSFGILPSILKDSIHEAYWKKRWQLTDCVSENDDRQFPTLGDLYYHVVDVVKRRGYASNTTSADILAAAAGRIRLLLTGSTGRMLNTRSSTPISEIMLQPTVLEMESLSDDDQALTTLFLLTFLREYASTTRHGTHMRHVTLIEEAHRLMKSAPHVSDREVSADTRAEAADMLSGALSEMRKLGEGVIIAEQLPNRLTDDALESTNLKIIHRLSGERLRQSVGASMNLDEEQVKSLTQLPIGMAVCYSQEQAQAMTISIEDYRAKSGLPTELPDERIKDRMRDVRTAPPNLPYAGCAYCRKQCRYRDQSDSAAYSVTAQKSFIAALLACKSRLDRRESLEAWAELIQPCRDALAPQGLDDDTDALYCYFAHFYDQHIDKDLVEAFRLSCGRSGT